MSILQLTDAEVAFGDRKLLDRASLVLHPGEKVALIGRNGAGKSTLLKVLGGSIPLDDGSLWTAEGITASSLDQSVPSFEDSADQTIYHVVVEGLGELGGLLERYRAVAEQGSGALQELSRIESSIETMGGWNLEQRVAQLLDRMALPADLLLRDCSGGTRRRAMLARALVAQPDLLLLDEPTNHLDIPAIDALQSLLTATAATVVFVTHDRALIDAVATRIVEVDRGTLLSYPGDYATYLARRRKADEEEATHQRRFDQHLAREEAWIREGIKARRTRNEGRVKRLEELRARRAARLERQGKASLQIDEGKQSGEVVAVLEAVSFDYGTPLIQGFSTRIMRGDRVGIIGANGSGKSTLLRLILGELSPQRGTVALGTRLRTAYFDQQRSRLDERLTVRESVGEGSDTITVAGRSRHVVGYLADFLFPPSQLDMPVARLSGGEKNRLLMAKLFAQPANLLVLDEPTNDLDVETLELLEELLGEFAGTLLLVSHDRAFLDAVVTSTIVFETDGTLREYVGGYSDWQRYTQSKRSQSASQSTAKRDNRSDAPARARVRTTRRLGYREQRELTALPDRIEALEAELALLQTRVSAPDFYQQDRTVVQAALDELGALSQTIEEAYERWQTLSDL